jgi:AcrR family transcriptional regulator
MPRPRGTRTRLSAAERRGLILESAKTLFSTAGYGRTSMDDIAAAAGITKPVVYDHFPSKKALYYELMRGLRDELLRQASANLAASATSRDRFRQAIGDFFAQVKRDPAVVELLFVQPRNQPDLLKEWERLQGEAIANLKPLVRSLAPRLKPWQLGVAAHLLHHGLNATAEAWPREASAEDMAGLLARLFWGGLEEFA